MKIWLVAISSLLISLPVWPVSAEDRVDPSEDPHCWSESVCITNADNKDGPDGRFDNETAAAVAACGRNYGFCYPPAVNYNLSIGIPLTGTVTTSVADLGDYVDKAYKYLLAISMIIAVIMMMVGGLQYISSPGGQEASKAKDRITRSLTGLVLLMCATLILFTVNPQLISLEMPPIPKTRTVFFISDATTCEDLISAGGYTIEPDTGLCGGEDGKIVAMSGVAVNPADQESCKWDTCQDADEECLSPTTGESEPACYSCLSVNDSTGISITSSTCSRLTPDDTSNIDFECFLGPDDDSGSCALAILDCSVISSCSDYMNFSSVSAEGKGLGITLFRYSLAWSDISDNVISYAEEICEISDPCGVGPCEYDMDVLSGDECEDVLSSLDYDLR